MSDDAHELDPVVEKMAAKNGGSVVKPDWSIIRDAVKRVAEWPEWKRKMFEAFSKRNSE